MSKDTLKDSISDFHSDGICFETKTIELIGDIDESMKNRTIKNLHLLDQVSGEVTIVISSSGGDVSDGLAIIDAIRAMKNYVRIIAYGGVESMASVIFQAGDKRFMMPNSYLMIHEGENGVVADKKKDKVQWERLAKIQDDACADIYLRRIKQIKPRFTKSKLDLEMDKDWILTPKEAISWGLADEILDTY